MSLRPPSQRSSPPSPPRKFVCICHDETQDGIPSFCKDDASTLCPLHPLNPYLAANKYMLMLGNVGMPHFDRNRRRYQG